MGKIVPEGGNSKKSAAVVAPIAVVPETRFGFWFLSTQTWVKYVLSVAINDLTRLISDRQSAYPVMLDVGCGLAFGPENISYPYLWWNRPDLGICERLGFSPAQIRDETLLNVVARKR